MLIDFVFVMFVRLRSFVRDKRIINLVVEIVEIKDRGVFVFLLNLRGKLFFVVNVFDYEYKLM